MEMRTARMEKMSRVAVSECMENFVVIFKNANFLNIAVAFMCFGCECKPLRAN